MENMKDIFATLSSFSMLYHIHSIYFFFMGKIISLIQISNISIEIYN